MPDSRFSAACQTLQDQFIVPVFYLYDFTPEDLEKIRKRFPLSRIIGIACPAPTVEKACLAILKTRHGLVESEKKTTTGQAKQKK